MADQAGGDRHARAAGHDRSAGRGAAPSGCSSSGASTSRPTSRLRAATRAASWWSGRAGSGSCRAAACCGGPSSTSRTASRPAARAACCRWRSRATTGRSRRFWVYYTDQEGFIQIDQFRAGAGTPNRADPASRRSVIRVPHHRFNHKGGQLQVGPDGYLYAGFGDGGGGGDPDENAQNLGRMLGEADPHRPEAERRLHDPARQSVPESRRRAPRDLRVRRCGIRIGSPSTAAPEASPSATSARTRSRRSTSSPAAPAAASRAAATTSAGTPSRAATATRAAARRARYPPSSSTRTARASARSPAAT